MMSEFSVVITTYNREADCRRAVNSVLAQSTSLIVEIIIVDDGSKDDYDVEWFTGKGCTYVKTANGGYCAARNVGFSIATHEWVALLDDDDWWKPDHLNVMSTKIQNAQSDVVMVYSQVTDFFADGSQVDRLFKIQGGDQSDLDFIFENGRLPSATCYKKSAVTEIPFAGNDRFSEDIWHSGRLLSKGRSIPVHECTVMYNQTSMGATRGSNLRTYLAAITAYSGMRCDPDFRSVRDSIFIEKLAWWYYFGLLHVSSELNWKQWSNAAKGLLRYNSVALHHPFKAMRRTISNIQLILNTLAKRLLRTQF